ncbi:MAG: PDZ domain-containing protein, partial [Planctomycetota bacterium]|nr:PDZ domain-containing protein [Planctomycetota bacterium]
RDHGHRVKEVLPESPASRAGVKVGDIVTRAENIPIRSEDDFRWSLHRLRDQSEIAIHVTRESVQEPVALNLRLPAGWRKGDISWRKSLRSYPVVWGFLGYPVGQEERKTTDIPEHALAIKVVSLRGQSGGVARALGLQKGDVIVSIEDDTRARTLEQFKSELLGRYGPGDTMRLKIRRGTETIELSGEFPDWFTSDRTVP